MKTFPSLVALLIGTAALTTLGSLPASASSVGTQVARGQEQQDPRGQEQQDPRGQEQQDPRGQETQNP